MTPISPTLLGARDARKSILAALLPQMAPTARLERLALECGHRSDAAMAAYTAPSPKDPDRALTARAAAGQVLPLLVAAALPALAPTHNPRATGRPASPEASDILALGQKYIHQETFATHMHDPHPLMEAIAPGACRWFFATMVAGASMQIGPGTDTFWASKGSQLMTGFLVLRPRFPTSAATLTQTEDLLPLLRTMKDLDPAPFNGWERVAHTYITGWCNSPDKTAMSILATVQERMEYFFAHPHNPRNTSRDIVPRKSSRPFNTGISPAPWRR